MTNCSRIVFSLGDRETKYMKIFCSICIFDGGASDWISLKVVCSICISVERESDWIYEDHVLDPRSTPLSLHKSTSNQAWGKQPFLSIQITVTFHDSSSYWNFVYNIFLQLWILFILFTHLIDRLFDLYLCRLSLERFKLNIRISCVWSMLNALVTS